MTVKRIICMLLVSMMLVSVFVACNKNTEDPVGSDAETDVIGSSDVVEESESEEQVRYDENGFIMDNLDKHNIDLNGKQINILTGSERVKKIYVGADELKGVMPTAVFNRHIMVTKRLNCKLNYVTVADGYGTDSDVIKQVQAMTSEDSLDLIAIYSLTQSSLMMQGMLQDLCKSNVLELDMPWWNQSMVDSCTINDSLYFASGDICYSLIECAFAYLYNKELADENKMNAYISETYGVEDIYELVESGKWTYDKMIAMCKLFYENSDGTKTKDDTYAFASHIVGIDNFYQASGMLLTKTGDDGSMLISADINSAKAGKLVADLIDFFSLPGVMCEGSNSAALSDGTSFFDVYYGGNALFFNHQLNAADRTNKNFDEGILPSPKFDEDQTDYLCVPSNGFTIWSIARGTSSEYEDLCAVMEAMASEGHRKTYSTYFNTVLSDRQESVDDYNMLQIIRKGIVLDGGRIMSAPFEEHTWQTFRKAVIQERDYLSYYENYALGISEQAIALNSLIRNYEFIYGE